MNLTKTQQNNVNKVIKKLEEVDKVVFQAPTGAGKTFMSYAITSYFAYNDYVVFITTLSKADLYKEIYSKFRSYVFSAKDIRPPMLLLVDATRYNNPDPSLPIKRTLPVLEGAGVYILGNSSFHKGGSLKDQDLLTELLVKLKANGKKILHIKDESHVEAQVDKVISSFADKTLYMSATPKRRTNIVEMKDEDSRLLKQELVLVEDSSLSHKEVLDLAMSDLKDIAVKYNKKDIRPALLIQVNDVHKSSKTYKHLRDEIVDACERHGLKWATTFHGKHESWNDSSYTLDDLKDNQSEIDVIIFKTSIATGWDIPRATSLIQFRDVAGERLNTQTIGRIRRKAVLNGRDKVFNKYFVYKV